MRQRAAIDGDDDDNTLWGTARADVIRGLAGKDIIFTGDGNDSVSGGGGDDSIHADEGNDDYVGGGGEDTIFFNTFRQDDDHHRGRRFDGGVTLDLEQRSAQDFGILGRDSMNGFEHAAGSYGDDVLRGTDGANTLNGIDGDDLLVGRGGNDELTGGEGRNMYIGGEGLDTIVLGGAKRDTVRFTGQYDAIVQGISAGGDAPPVGPAEEVYWFDHTRQDGDRLDFHAIDADTTRNGNQDFTFVGTDSFREGHVGEIRLYLDLSGQRGAGAFWQVLVNLDDDVRAEMRVYVMDDDPLEAFSFIL